MPFGIFASDFLQGDFYYTFGKYLFYIFPVLLFLKPGKQFLPITEHWTDQNARIGGNKLVYLLFRHGLQIGLALFICLAFGIYEFLDG